MRFGIILEFLVAGAGNHFRNTPNKFSDACRRRIGQKRTAGPSWDSDCNGAPCTQATCCGAESDAAAPTAAAQAVLNALAPKVEGCRETFTAQNVGNALYGLHNMSNTPDVEALLRVLLKVK